MKSQVLVVGMGAVGSLYASFLDPEKTVVDCISQSESTVIRDQGIAMTYADGSTLTWRPRRVYAHLTEVPEAPDFILICTKVLPEIDIISQLSPVIGPNTSIVLIQNGLFIEQPYLQAYPHCHLISALAFVCVSKTAPRCVHHQDYGRLVLGDFPQGTSEKSALLGRLFLADRVACKISDHIQSERYKKLIWNAPFNPLSVILGGKNTAELLHSDQNEALIRTLMCEVQAIASADGIVISDDIIEKNISDTKKMTPYKTSMCLDWEHQRPLETEAILGNVIRRAEMLGVSCPELCRLYAQLS